MITIPCRGKDETGQWSDMPTSSAAPPATAARQQPGTSRPGFRGRKRDD